MPYDTGFHFTLTTIFIRYQPVPLPCHVSCTPLYPTSCYHLPPFLVSFTPYSSGPQCSPLSVPTTPLLRYSECILIPYTNFHGLCFMTIILRYQTIILYHICCRWCLSVRGKLTPTLYMASSVRFNKGDLLVFELLIQISWSGLSGPTSHFGRHLPLKACFRRRWPWSSDEEDGEK